MNFATSLKRISIVSSIVLFSILFFSSYVIADTGPNITPGGGKTTGITYDCSLDSNGKPIPGKLAGDCNFYDFIAAAKKLVNVGTIFGLAFSVVVIAYAGYIYLTSGGSAGERSRANKMFVKVGWGILALLGAWLLVNLIVTALLDPALRSSSSFPI